MIKRIDELKPDSWSDIEVTVQELWDNDHPAIRQVGILKDASGIIKFVSWEKSDQPLLEEGETYRINSTPVTKFEDRLSVALVSTTLITRLSAKQVELPTV